MISDLEKTLKSKTMEAVFPALDKEEEKEIAEQKVMAECCLFKSCFTSQNQENSLEEQVYHIKNVCLQIRGNFVLEKSIESSKIQSGFRCDIDKNFLLLRKNMDEADQVGDLLGIQFSCSKWANKTCFLYIADENREEEVKKLEKFGEILGRKYVKQGGFHEVYRAIKKIGKGVTASVYKALRLTDGKQFAVKSFKKQTYYEIDQKRGKAAFEKQFKAMTRLCDSKYVCKLISVYESENSIYIVMELLNRSLFSYLRTKGFPCLKLAKQLIYKLLIGLRNIHMQGYIHRDLKLENIMILEKENDLIDPIIIDLGLAEEEKSETFLYVKCGTPGYVAPEILSLKANQLPKPPYSNKCDVFSLGVIFYILLVGKTVFEGSDEREVVRLNRDCAIDYSFAGETKLEPEAKDLLAKMLQKQPQDRPSVEELLKHEFFKKDLQLAETASSIELEQK